MKLTPIMAAVAAALMALSGCSKQTGVGGHRQ